MRRLAGMAAALALGLTLAATTAAALAPPEREGSLRRVFDLYAAGIWVGELRLDAAVRSDGYVAGASIETAGIVRAFFDAKLSAEATGTIDGGTLEPERFRTRKVEEDETEVIEIAYADGAPAAIEFEPEWEPRAYSLDPLAQGRVADPLTGALSALAPRSGNFCDRRVEMFDGKKRFAITLGPAREDGDRIKCEGRWERVGGYKAKMMRPGRRVAPFTLWFDRGPDGLWSPVRAVMPTEIVPLTLVRRD